MGLGLANSWGIRQSGGVIRVESAPGNGSSSRICLTKERADARQESASILTPRVPERTDRDR